MSVREKVKSWLSENRDPTAIAAGVFPAIDLDFVRKKHRPKSQGEEDGANDLPASSATALSATEIGLIGEFQQYQQEYVQRFNQQQLAYKERVQTITQSWDIEAIRNEENEKVNEVIAQALTDEAELHSQKMRLIGRGVEYLKFREANGLMGRLPDIRDRWLSLIILTVFYVAELIVTFFLTREAGSALEVSLIALVYCSLNCAFPWFLASFCRSIYLTWKRAGAKITGLALTVVLIVSGIAMNLMMGHYRGVSMELARDASNSDPSDFEAASAQLNKMQAIGADTIDRLIDTPFALGEPQAYLLAIFGMLCFFVSWHDGLIRDDKYPGYGRQNKLYEDAYDDYDSELEEVTTRLLAAQRENVTHIQNLKKDLISSIERVPLIVQASQGLTAACDNALVTLNANLQQLATEYRMANQAKRNDDPPDYFQSPAELTALDLNIPNFPPLEVGVAQKLEKMLDGFAEELHSKYGEILDRLQDGPTILRDAENLECHPLTVERRDG